jgi:hypothetical protein
MVLAAAVVSTPVHSAEPPSNPGGYDCTFERATEIAAGTTPFSVAVGDLNGDGVVDIAVANQGSNDVSILLATGAGTFGSPGTLPVGNEPRALAVADLNNDGQRDLVVASHSGGAHNVSVLLGTGAGAFATAVGYAQAGNPTDVAIADFNVDGKPDLAVTKVNSGTVSILFGNGAGGFGTATPIAVGGQLPQSVVSGDFNKDGKPDLAVANCDSETVSILLGSGGGAFKKAVTYSSSAIPTAAPPTELVLVDLDADDRLDLVVATDASYPRVISVLRGLDGGTFAALTAVTVEEYPPRGVAAGDFIAWGQFRGDEIRIETQRAMVQGDPHPIAKYRVNGPLSNLPAFRETFRCAAGDSMVREGEDLCEVW